MVAEYNCKCYRVVYGLEILPTSDYTQLEFDYVWILKLNLEFQTPQKVNQ